MALTKDFRETVMARAQRDGAFRREMLKTGVELMLSDDEEDAAIGREQLRDYINSTIGFQELGRLVDKGANSLMQMFSDRGNPSTKNLALILSQLKAHEGVEIGVTLRKSRG